MKKILMGLLVSAFCATSYGEFRVWTDKDGTPLEAQLVKISGQQVVLQTREQKIVKVDMASLSLKDKKFAELNSPPKIEIDVSVDMDRTNESRGGGRFGGQVQHESVVVDVKLMKQGSATYDAPLRAHLLVLGELQGKGYWVVMERKTTSFNFRDENVYQFSSRGQEVRQREMNAASSSLGLEYEGYLVVVADPQGHVLAIKGSRKALEAQVEVLKEARRGSVYDEDFKLIDDGTRAKEMKARNPRPRL